MVTKWRTAYRIIERILEVPLSPSAKVAMLSFRMIALWGDFLSYWLRKMSGRAVAASRVGGRCGTRTRTGEARGILGAFRLPISASGLLYSTLPSNAPTHVSHAHRRLYQAFPSCKQT